MRYFKFILVIAFLFAGSLTLTGQETEKSIKIETAEVPTKVKKTLGDYAGYKIEEQASYIKKRGAVTIYEFTIQRKYSSFVLRINKKGKVVGIKDGEGVNRS
ncbi:MAG: hypothetical protein HKN90_01015 [Flavobacteriaceae bacterium]|nr:hypothetical protein [Flavobacteriaceae bacterium]